MQSYVFIALNQPPPASSYLSARYYEEAYKPLHYRNHAVVLYDPRSPALKNRGTGRKWSEPCGRSVRVLPLRLQGCRTHCRCVRL